MSTILKFLKNPIVCKWKFNTIYKQYKDDKITNKILNNDRHECPFYDALVVGKIKSGNVVKHVNIYVNETKEVIGSP
jgi:hypothetical protein